ncbi:histone-lysine N-methyltransferase SETDB2-like [Lacerta agilis]|uniref:histone-lysine N-methyltransferase SETDB2-like n=1 Tax=Lacerta agilis TaxID=80427 RepID=UPI001419FA31|nr:histone-lysine N-methyltransferase SETDB2-like [Lacerta agilis]
MAGTVRGGEGATGLSPLRSCLSRRRETRRSVGRGPERSGFKYPLNHNSPCPTDDATVFWRQMEDSRVDLIFEQVQKVLWSLKQKIKDRTATDEEYCQALAFVNQVDMTNFLPLTNVSSAVIEEDMQKFEPVLHPSASSEIIENPGDDFSLRMEIKEAIDSRSKGELTEVSSKFPYEDHVCSKECLAKRPWNSYKDENPLNLPMLFRFQRWHAKPDSVSKSHNVIYKAPCGRSLRNFQDVQNYLFQTECTYLYLDHFSFNTYVQVFRSNPSCQPFVFDFDISNGAETIPVSFCNDIDHDRLPYFKYRKVSWPHGYFLNNFSSMFFDSCSCTDGCTDRTKCACLLLTERNCHEASVSSGKEASNGYIYKRLDGPVPSGIYECSVLCSCDKIMCQNRLVQHGLQVRLQVFKTEKKGWGVRCLDDIDKGTFVCTYSGKLMSKDESREPKDKGGEVKEEGTENGDRSHTLFKKRIKLDILYSDSETEVIQTTRKQKYLPVKGEDQQSVIQSYQSYSCNSTYEAVTRPKTRTPVLQEHRRQLGIAGASSDEDGSSVCQEPARSKVTTAAKKGDGKSSLQEELGEIVSTVQSEGSVDGLSNTTLSSKPAVQDDRVIKKKSKDLFWTQDTHKKSFKRGRGESDHKKQATEDSKAFPKNKESPCLLDATKEGNVGRFLNHSCSPNLFAQSVFVESHDRNFQWVAFFTNRHVKAGTELTWDYGYEAGSMPETETTCQCGAHKCRKKILYGTSSPPHQASISSNIRGKPGSSEASLRGFCRRVGLAGEDLAPPPPVRAQRERPPPVTSPGPCGKGAAGGAAGAAAEGDFAKLTWIMAKMVRRQCAFCPDDEECAIMYVAEGQNLAVHQDCLLYSSGFVESEEHNPENLDIRFDVASVTSEIKRGKRLICNFCRKKGATVGCEIKNCRRSYHYFCALCDDAAIETDEIQGIYRVFCPNHDPVKKTSFYAILFLDEDSKKGRLPILMNSSCSRKKMNDNETVAEESLQQVLKRKNDQQKVRIDFLRKCKQAGLLDEIFEEMLDTLHLAQEKLMDDNTSEAEYEETVMSLFDCGLFENILATAHSGTEEKIQQLLHTRKRLDTQIELLKDLKEVVLPAPEDTASVSNSISEQPAYFL